jgi:hypothetical protein
MFRAISDFVEDNEELQKYTCEIPHEYQCIRMWELDKCERF